MAQQFVRQASLFRFPWINRPSQAPTPPPPPSETSAPPTATQDPRAPPPLQRQLSSTEIPIQSVSSQEYSRPSSPVFKPSQQISSQPTNTSPTKTSTASPSVPPLEDSPPPVNEAPLSPLRQQPAQTPDQSLPAAQAVPQLALQPDQSSGQQQLRQLTTPSIESLQGLSASESQLAAPNDASDARPESPKTQSEVSDQPISQPEEPTQIKANTALDGVARQREGSQLGKMEMERLNSIKPQESPATPRSPSPKQSTREASSPPKSPAKLKTPTTSPPSSPTKQVSHLASSETQPSNQTTSKTSSPLRLPATTPRSPSPTQSTGEASSPPKSPAELKTPTTSPPSSPTKQVSHLASSETQPSNQTTSKTSSPLRLPATTPRSPSPTQSTGEASSPPKSPAKLKTPTSPPSSPTKQVSYLASSETQPSNQTTSKTSSLLRLPAIQPEQSTNKDTVVHPLPSPVLLQEPDPKEQSLPNPQLSQALEQTQMQKIVQSDRETKELSQEKTPATDQPTPTAVPDIPFPFRSLERIHVPTRLNDEPPKSEIDDGKPEMETEAKTKDSLASSADNELKQRTITELPNLEIESNKHVADQSDIKNQAEKEKQPTRNMSEMVAATAFQAIEGEAAPSLHAKKKTAESWPQTKSSELQREPASFNKDVNEGFPRYAHKLVQGIQNRTLDGSPASVTALCGTNTGASMHMSIENSKAGQSSIAGEVHDKGESGLNLRRSYDFLPREVKAGKTYVNNNVQGVNNSILHTSSIRERTPGIHLAFSHQPTEFLNMNSIPQNVTAVEKDDSQT